MRKGRLLSWDILLLLAECPGGLETVDIASVLLPNDKHGAAKVRPVLRRLRNVGCLRSEVVPDSEKRPGARGMPDNRWFVHPFSARAAVATKIIRWDQPSLFPDE